MLDPVYPLVRAPVATTMCNRAVGLPAAGDEAESQRCQENCGFPHAFLYPAPNLLSTLLSASGAEPACASVGRHQKRARTDSDATRHGARAARHESAIAAATPLSSSLVCGSTRIVLGPLPSAALCTERRQPRRVHNIASLGLGDLGAIDSPQRSLPSFRISSLEQMLGATSRPCRRGGECRAFVPPSGGAVFCVLRAAARMQEGMSCDFVACHTVGVFCGLLDFERNRMGGGRTAVDGGTIDGDCHRS